MVPGPQPLTGSSRSEPPQGGHPADSPAIGRSRLPASVHRRLAEPMRSGGLAAIEHVILLMQENRSFDHYYGTLRGVRGYGDRSVLRRRAGGTVMRQAGGPYGDVVSFSVRAAAADAGRTPSDIQYVGHLPHEFPDATRAWADGWWDAWVPNKTAATMTFYDRADIPLQYELAETFTTLDAYHCSIFGATNPNRCYFWTGKVGEEPDGSGRAVSNAAYEYDHAGYNWTTYPERLEAAGVSWRIYQEWDNFTDNAVEYFAPFKRIGHRVLAHVDGGFRTTEEFYDSLPSLPSAEQDRLLAQLEVGRAALSAAERSLFDRAMYRSRPGSLLARIRADIAAGTLPRVVWLVPPAALCEHPAESTPLGSANLIHDLLDLVASDAGTWASTVTMINFDENDGFFDHVPPPIPPRPDTGDGEDWYAGLPIGLGPRVPMTIVSPWTVGGFVDSSIADHTSTLRFLEFWTGVAEPNISAWRRGVCSDLTSAFDFERAHCPPTLARPDPVPTAIPRWRPEPPPAGDLPEQEAGRRPARPLPYRPVVSVRVDGAVLRVSLGHDGELGVVAYTVYPFAPALPTPVFVAARAGQREQVRIGAAEGLWDLVVQGPNGFWYELAGSLDGPAARVDVRVDGSGDPGAVALRLVNDGDEPVELTVRPLGYAGDERRVALPPGGSQPIAWPTDHGWYDVEVTAVGDGAFRRRVTGHVDVGQPSMTA